MRDLTTLIIGLILLLHIAADIKENRRGTGVEYGIETLYIGDTAGEHTNAFHIIGDWDCHIKVNNTCYVFTPDGVVVEAGKSGFSTGWAEAETFGDLFDCEEEPCGNQSEKDLPR